jgi:transposase
MRHVELTETEIEKLRFVLKHGKTFLERNRSMCLLLSGQGYSMSKVAEIMKISRMTVKRLLDSWQNASDSHFENLYRVKGQGAKSKLEPVRDKIPQLFESNNRNIGMVLEELEKKYGITVCKGTLQAFLKGTGIYI